VEKGHRDSHRQPETARDGERQPETARDSQRQPETARDSQGQSETATDSQRLDPMIPTNWGKKNIGPVSHSIFVIVIISTP